ncbi:CG34002 [Drosophila busckii]|uniref:CG34002 n=1 Tax=Drosophila busckii TaxID=30019 RepID=A0A0M4ETH5_DROBS|nr:scoloptoxin SSD43 [Drosophila busckii]ALC40825.1 CG34002 [Drosophila busckii]
MEIVRCLLQALILVITLGQVLTRPKYCRAPELIKIMDREAFCNLDGQPHAACGKKKWAGACGTNMRIMRMTPVIRNLILRHHNTYRNIIAKGALHDLPGSDNMMRMHWDEDLGVIARQLVKQCTLQPTFKYINTKTIAQPGINTAFNKYRKKIEQSPIKIIKSQIKAWYDEYRYVTIDSLLSAKSPAGQETAHFLNMMIGPSNAMGCAISTYEPDDTWRTQLLICLYRCKKTKKSFTYSIGKPPAGKCECGSDREFKNLCDSNERADTCEVFFKSKNATTDLELEPKPTTPEPISDETITDLKSGLTKIRDFIRKLVLNGKKSFCRICG